MSRAGKNRERKDVRPIDQHTVPCVCGEWREVENCFEGCSGLQLEPPIWRRIHARCIMTIQELVLATLRVEQIRAVLLVDQPASSARVIDRQGKVRGFGDGVGDDSNSCLVGPVFDGRDRDPQASVRVGLRNTR